MEYTEDGGDFSFSNFGEFQSEILDGITRAGGFSEGLSHPLHGVLLRLIREVKATLLGEPIDPTWTLENEIRAALMRDEVRECVFLDHHRIRYHPDTARDDFVLATLGLYESILACFPRRRGLPNAAEQAREAVAAIVPAAPLTQVVPSSDRGVKRRADEPLAAGGGGGAGHAGPEAAAQESPVSWCCLEIYCMLCCVMSWIYIYEHV